MQSSFARSYLLFQQLCKFNGNRIPDLRRFGGAANVLGPDAFVNGDLDGLVDLLCKFGQAEGIFQHHAHREDGGDWVDDTLTGDVWRRAWKRLLSALKAS